MKVLFILTLFLALSLAAPVKDSTNDSEGIKVNRRYSLRKNLRRDAAVKPPPGSVAPEGIAASVNSRDTARVGAVKKKVGTKPFGEPDAKATTEPVFPPKPVEPEPIATKAPKLPPTLPPTTRAPPTEAAPQPAIAPTQAALPPPPPPPQPQVNTTGTATSSGNEDDSSSEEDDEEDNDEEDDDYVSNDYDDDDDDGRQLFPLHKPKTKGTHQPEDALSSKYVEPEQKPIKVKAFVTQTGQILVPIETFQEYFDFPAHAVVPQELDPNSYGPPAGYIVSRQEPVEQEQGTSNVGSSEEESSETSNTAGTKDEEEAESEESVPQPTPAPTKAPNQKNVYKPKPKNPKPTKAQQQQPPPQPPQVVELSETASEEAEERESEEKAVDSSVSIETEEKVTSVESAETNVPPKPQVKPKPAKPQPQAQRPGGRPPLASIPAGAPTGEDDEEEAGRAGFFGFSPIYETYYDDSGFEPFDQDHDYYL